MSEGKDDARFARLTLEQREARAAAARSVAQIKERENAELHARLLEMTQQAKPD